MPELWTEDEKIYLEYYLYDNETKNYQNASDFLGRSDAAIRNKAYKMRKQDENISYLQKDFEQWEIEYIKKNYFLISTALMSEHLDRSRDVIIWKANQLGITKLQKVRDYDTEIRDLASKGYTRAAIARELGLKPKSVGDYINRNKIECRYAERAEMGGYFRELEQARCNEMRKKYK